MKTGIIGAGNMASALFGGFLSAGILAASDIFLSDTDEIKLDTWKKDGVNCSLDNLITVENSDIVIFAVKPAVLPNVLGKIGKRDDSKIYVSIAAGYSLEKIESFLGESAKIVRVMPNTPALVGCGMSVITPNKNISADELESVKKLFSAVGEVVVLEEKFMNAATSVHSCSPAFVYMLIDAMADAGVKYGISKNTALKLAAKAVEGAAKMVLESDEHIMKLKDNVCSPQGTTIEGVLSLESSGFRSDIQKAVIACTEKAEKM